MVRSRQAVLLTSDIDMTLQAGDWHPEQRPYADAALEALSSRILLRRETKRLPPFFVGTSTGHTLISQTEELEYPAHNTAFQPFVELLHTKTGSVGAEIVYRQVDDGPFVPAHAWPGSLSDWNRNAAHTVLLPRVRSGELRLQPSIAQSDVKLSYVVVQPPSYAEGYAEEIEEELYLRARIASTVIFSNERYLDILPRQADGSPVTKGTALLFTAQLVAECYSLAEEPLLVFVGDSENDKEGIAAAIESGGFGIIPANARQSFKQRMRRLYSSRQLHIAQDAAFASAIQEALELRDML